MSNDLPSDYGFEQFRDGLRQLAGYLINPNLRARIDPSDLVQQTFLGALKEGEALASLDPAARWMWLKKALIHHITNANRHASQEMRDYRREIPLPGDDESSACWERLLVSMQDSPGGQAERNEWERRLSEPAAGFAPPPDASAELRLLWALGQLKPREREAVVLKYVHEKSQQEVATELGLTSAGQVAGLLRRALDRLHELLSPETP